MRHSWNARNFVWLLVFLSGCASQGNIEERIQRQVLITISENNFAVPAVNSYAGNPFSKSQSRSSHVIVRNILNLHGLKKVAQWSIKALNLEAVLAEVKGKRPLSDVITSLRKDQRVESVQRVSTYKLLGYNDPYFHMQSSAMNEDIERIHGLATGKDVVVGIVDTGVDRDHAELRDKILYTGNFVDHDQHHFDGDEHGTAVAGVIASRANNQVGIVGVAPDVKLMVFKACWQDVSRQRASCDSFSVMKALVEVVKRQPDVLNLSLAGPPDPLIERLIRVAVARGIVVVAAADSGGESFPASMDEVIAVSTPLITGEGELPRASLLAPGIDVLTTTPGSTYGFKTGSSIATAYVTGITALMKEREPALSGLQVQTLLLSSSSSEIHDIPVVDLCAAVSRGREGEFCPSSAIVFTQHE